MKDAMVTIETNFMAFISASNRLVIVHIHISQAYAMKWTDEVALQVFNASS